MMLEAVQARFGGIQAPHPVEWLSDNGLSYTARKTRIFATQLNLAPCFTPVASPESNGMSEAFVKTLKRDYLRVSPGARRQNRALPDHRMDRRLQREPSSFRATDALASRVQTRPSTAEVSG
jgi:transposase InsO family protein